MSKTNHILSVVTDGPATRPTDRLTAGGKAKKRGPTARADAAQPTVPLTLTAKAATPKRKPSRFSLLIGVALIALLAAGGGAWCGALALPSILLIGAISGLTFVLIQRWRGKPVGGALPLPFGVFLAAGIWVTWLHGPLALS